MGTDVTVIMNVRHRFGNRRQDEPYLHEEYNADLSAPFVGTTGTFEFATPNVDRSQPAVLEFQYRGSNQYLTFPSPQPDGSLVGITPEHPVAINDIDLAGGVPAAPRYGDMAMWGTRLLIVNPGVLSEQNELRISALAGPFGTRDDFTIDNVVLFYKTRVRPSPTDGLVDEVEPVNNP
jgi:hypothetical protein